MNQLTLFENQDVPKSRQLALVKVAKSQGMEAAQARALLYSAYQPMQRAVEEQYKRRGEAKKPGKKIMGLNLQIKNAVGAPVSECTPTQMGIALAMRESFTAIIQSCDGGKEESDKRKAVAEAVIDFRTKLERIAA